MFNLLLSAAITVAQPQPDSQPPAQPRDREDYAPWLAEQEIRPGDRWYRVLIDIDTHGRATRCRIRASNDRNNDRRFWMCRAFLNGGFQTAPVMRDGVAVPGAVERTAIMPGRNSRDRYERARRDYRRQQRQN